MKQSIAAFILLTGLLFGLFYLSSLRNNADKKKCDDLGGVIFYGYYGNSCTVK